MKVSRIENLSVLTIRKPVDQDGERYAKEFFEGKGYQVLKLNSKDTIEEAGNLSKAFPFDLEKIIESERKGAPDFLVFRLFQEIEIDDYSVPKVSVSEELSDWFFLEVKDESDLRLSQLEWYVSHQEFPIRIAVMRDME